MAPFDSLSSCTTSYSYAIVSIALSCAIFELFGVEECRDLESHSRLFKVAPLDRRHGTPL